LLSAVLLGVADSTRLVVGSPGKSQKLQRKMESNQWPSVADLSNRAVAQLPTPRLLVHAKTLSALPSFVIKL
jgi:hypothetical protein